MSSAIIKSKIYHVFFLHYVIQLNAIFLIYINDFIYRAVDIILKIDVNSK